MPRPSSPVIPRLRTVVVATLVTAAAVAVPAGPAHAAATTVHAAPSGTGTSCTAAAPCSIRQWAVNADGAVGGAQSRLCLDATGAGTANGTRIVLWSCNGQANQRWNLRG